MEVQFADLENVDYKIDCIYKGGTEPFHKLIPGNDIAGILRRNSNNSTNVEEWLTTVDRQNRRLVEYCGKLNKMAKQPI
ncbi:MAG: hypothetical protein E7277_04150 [Lachnospiraceae bacterium]|jgi:hypothetical protein|nr:hypothetical protein [Lachnospiraceae bacterium]